MLCRKKRTDFLKSRIISNNFNKSDTFTENEIYCKFHKPLTLVKQPHPDFSGFLLKLFFFSPTKFWRNIIHFGELDKFLSIDPVAQARAPAQWAPDILQAPDKQLLKYDFAPPAHYSTSCSFARAKKNSFLEPSRIALILYSPGVMWLHNDQ